MTKPKIDTKVLANNLLFLYGEYEKKNISYKPILEEVKELYYLTHTGKTYEDYLKSKERGNEE